MRILFDNILLSSTLSSINPNVSYPIDNIKDDFLKVIYKATATTDTVTIDFASIKSIDCFYIGFTNASGITLRLYSALDVLLATKTINPATSGGVFSQVNDAAYATVSLSATDNLYIGSIGIGNTYTMPNPLNSVIKKKVDNSKNYISPDGQYSVNRIPWLRSVETKHYVIGIDLYNEIYALFSGIEHPVWVDVYEELNSAINPMYSIVSFDPDSQSWYKYLFNIKSTEPR